ncbi:COMM domain-containing protein 4-like [Sitophilus oryzae]|uniref:COMM domain-containing protein 4-like n=1 Tax=Sitophilus oryzae TaxID=7048 RepID=A0A6J2XDC3_SITOR|nr:COMM domain-containing protein 4-like [Sitophilus oryzae]
MKFRFNGDADCPDWILAEIYTLSRLSSIKLKLLGQIVVQGIINPPLQIEKVEKLFADSKLDTDINLKACIACLTYIISAATRFNCESSALQSELQQLGLPREHSISIKRVYDEQSGNLTDYFKSRSLKINNLEDVSGNFIKETGCGLLNLSINEKTESLKLAPNTIKSLLGDLVAVRNRMKDLKEAL